MRNILSSSTEVPQEIQIASRVPTAINSFFVSRLYSYNLTGEKIIYLQIKITTGYLNVTGIFSSDEGKSRLKQRIPQAASDS